MLKLLNNLQEAIDSMNDILEVDNLVIHDGSEVIFSNLDEKPNVEKIVKAIFNAKNNIGFELGITEIDIIGTSKIVKLFLHKAQIIMVFLGSDALISDTVLLEKSNGIFNFIKN